jgi:hypothetical protein
MGDAGDGQILVLGALMIAVLFVGLALVLNGAIYAENVASRQTTTTTDPVAMADQTETRLQRAAEAANWNRDDLEYAVRRSMVEDSVRRWNHNISSDGATRGVAVSSQVESTTEGVRVSQRDPDDFMPADESLDQYLLDSTIDPLGLTDRTNWKVAPNVQTRSLRVGVNRSELKEVDPNLLDQFGNLLNTLLTGSDAFWIQIDDGATTWRVYLFEVENEGEIAAVVTSDDGSETVEGVCSVDADWATLDVEAAELRGEETTDCPALSFYDDVGSHEMYWVGADEVNGTYHFIADEPEAQFRATLESEYESIIDSIDVGAIFPVLGLPDLLDDFTADTLLGQDGSPHPFTTSAVYDATLSFTYNEGDIRYERDVTVAGG